MTINTTKIIEIFYSDNFLSLLLSILEFKTLTRCLNNKKKDIVWRMKRFQKLIKHQEPWQCIASIQAHICQILKQFFP